MTSRVYLASAFVLVASVASASAQSDAFAMARMAAANQLGIMEYCQSKGDVSADAVDAQRKANAGIPGSGDDNGAAEALGRQGTMVAPNGNKTTLDSVAGAHNTTVASICQQMGGAVLQSAAAMRQSGAAAGAPGMPSLPNGMTMPGVPNGMTMPAMPNGMAMPAMPNGMAMPAMPGAPPPK